MRSSPLLLLLLLGCSVSDFKEDPVSLDELVLEVFETSREVGYTNKEAGFLYTETNAPHRNGWQGWHIASRKVLDDYAILVDNKLLSRSEVTLSLVSPLQLRRAYAVGVQEVVTLLDSVNALVIELSQAKGETVTLCPLFRGSHQPADYIVRSAGDVLLIARRPGSKSNPPHWIGATIVGEGPLAFPTAAEYAGAYAPAALRRKVARGSATAFIVVGESEQEAVALARSVAKDYTSRIAQRKQRMEDILRRAHVRTDNPRFDKAIHWAILSADALVMNQGRKGIFAGLPWFSNYWGRDSFISLPGVMLVTGAFGDAREVLRSFADWQDMDPASPMYGRIPNLVQPDSKIYNTADGTPWFVIALGEYVNYSGDTAFARLMYPHVKTAIEGTLRYRIDRNGLVTHEDAETWMDAVGPAGPWSPRGNRACDIQALWYRQLLVSTWLAGLLNDQRHFQEWFSYAEQVDMSFNRLFVDPDRKLVADHLNEDGSADWQLRPNLLFSLDIVDNPDIRWNIFRTVTESLVYPHGVASLSQTNPHFHPYHHYRPYYVQDAAYHNGVVWTWLAGQWISAASQFGYHDLAFTVTESMTDQILDRGAVGTISELVDAAPRPGEALPRLSGTFSQAWSLAEYLRVLYQNYLGVAIDAVEQKLELAPRLPSSISRAAFNVSAGGTIFRIEYRTSPSRGTILLTSPAKAPTFDVIVTWRLESGVEHNFAYLLPPLTNAEITIEDDEVSVNDGQGPRTIQMNVRKEFNPDESRPPLSLATPTVRPDLKALKGPGHVLLTNEQIKRSNPAARTVIDIQDPDGDDRGSGTYTYPATPALRPGSLDIRKFTVQADDSLSYYTLEFKDLSDPGWHPEYGFQLTFVAIAIDKDGIPGSGQVRVGRNAKFTLPASRAYETMIFVGGGIRVEDSKGKILAEYSPLEEDVRNPLGRVSTRSISFALPHRLVGSPSDSWRLTVLVGAQDDHGGSGLGDFREVTAEPSEWSGGGKRIFDGSNVYDLLESR